MTSLHDIFVVIFTPLARGMRRVNPNTLTAVSLGAGILAGLAFWLAYRSPLYYGLAALMLAVSGAADSLDGIVARMYGRTTTWGAFLDHVADRVVDVAVLTGIGLSPGANLTLGLSVVIVVLLYSRVAAQEAISFGIYTYGGAGKPGQFLGLIGLAWILFLFPEAAIPGRGGASLSLANLTLALLAFFTAGGIVLRVRRVYRRASTDPGLGACPRTPGTRS